MRSSGVELAQSIKRLENLLTLLQARGSAVSTSGRTTFVFRPGGVAGGNVFTTWPTLYAQLSVTQGPRWVAVDDSISPCVIPAGTYAVDGVTLVSTGNAVSILSFADGAHLTFRSLVIDTMIVEFEGATPVSTVTTTTCELELNSAELLNSGGTGLIAVGAGATLNVVASDSVIETGIFSTTDATATVDIRCFNGTFLSHDAVSGVGGSTLNIFADGSSMGVGVSATQTPAPTIVVLDPTPTFVFQPGGTAGGNVFTTWAALYASLSLFVGPKWVKVDPSIGAAHITAGGPYNLDLVTFLSDGSGATAASLFIDDGATFTGTGTTRITVRDIALRVAQVTNPVITLATGAACSLKLEGQGSIRSAAGAKPLVEAQTGSTVFFLATEASSIANGGAPVLQSDAGATFTLLVLDEASVAASTLTGAGAITMGWVAAATVSFTQGGLTTLTLAYLEAPNSVENANNTGTGTTTSTAVTGNIARKRSGQVRVWGVATGLISAAGTITVSLLRDATTIKALPPITVLATTGHSIPISVIDTLPDTANHTYTIQQVADGAHTITVGANGNEIQAQEL